MDRQTCQFPVPFSLMLLAAGHLRRHLGADDLLPDGTLVGYGPLFKLMKRHPRIVVGPIQKQTNHSDLFKRHQIKIRLRCPRYAWIARVSWTQLTHFLSGVMGYSIGY